MIGKTDAIAETLILWPPDAESQLTEIQFSIWVLLNDNCYNKWGFPCGSDSKESACNVGDLGLIPGSGRSPGEGNGNKLQKNILLCITINNY